jgi:very-short-patch-repair endonuclease
MGIHVSLAHEGKLWGMLKESVLRGIFRLKRQKVERPGDYCIMRNFKFY